MADSFVPLGVKITGSSAGFTETVNTATKEAERFAAGLQRQVNAANLVGRSIEAYELRLKGASDESVRRIESLQREVAEMNAAKEAERQRADVMERGASLTKSLATDAERYRARMSDLRSMLQQGAISQEIFNRAMREGHVAAVQQQQLLRRESFGLAGGAAAKGGGVGGASFAIQQLAFAAQDAATVFGTAGLAGAVRASSNNVIQFASLISPLAGTIVALVGTGLALWVDGMDKAEKQQKKLEEATRKGEDAFRKMTQAIQEQGAAFRERQHIAGLDGKNALEGAKRQGAERKAELEAENKAIREQQELLQKRIEEGDPEIMKRREEQETLRRLQAGEPLGRINVEKDASKQKEFLAERARLAEEARKNKAQLQDQLDANQRELKRIEENKKALDERIRKDNELGKVRNPNQNDRAFAEQQKEQERRDKLFEDNRRKEEDADRRRKALQAQILGHTKSGKQENIIAEFKERMKELEESGFDEATKRHLQDQLAEGSAKRLADLTGRGSAHANTGAAEFGSQEALRNVASANSLASEQEERKRALDLAKQQLEAQKAIAANTAKLKDPFGVVSIPQ